jgi:hypothetical protein
MLASLEACRISLERAREIAQAEFDLAEIEARNGVDLDPADLSAIGSIHQLVGLIAAAATVSQPNAALLLECRALDDEMNWCRVGCSDLTRDPARRTINATNLPEVIFQCLLNASDFLPP